MKLSVCRNIILSSSIKKELNLDWLDKHQLNIATDNQCKLLDSIDKINYVDSPDANLTKENWLDLQAQIHKLHW